MVWGGTATLQISIEGMVLYVIETEFVERLTKVEERSKSNTHQINDLKPVIEEKMCIRDRYIPVERSCLDCHIRQRNPEGDPGRGWAAQQLSLIHI